MGYPYGAVGGWFQIVSTACRMPLGSSVVLDAVARSGVSRTDQSVSLRRLRWGAAVAVSQLSVQPLLESETVALRDVVCRGECKHASDEERAKLSYLVFPYRGVYVRHLGGDDAVAEANQVLFFNADEGYRVSHPVVGGDACLSLWVTEPVVRELAPKARLREGAPLAFRRQRLRIDARAQALVALLRHGLRRNAVDTLQAETLVLTLVLTLVRRSLGERTSHAAGASAGRQKLVDRAKLALSTDLGRRWTLAEIGHVRPHAGYGAAARFDWTAVGRAANSAVNQLPRSIAHGASRTSSGHWGLSPSLRPRP